MDLTISGIQLSYMILGNSALCPMLGSAALSEDTGEPFCFLYMTDGSNFVKSSNLIIYKETTNEETIHIDITGPTYSYNKLSEVYLPERVGKISAGEIELRDDDGVPSSLYVGVAGLYSTKFGKFTTDSYLESKLKNHNHTLSQITDLANATDSTAGLMSAEDKIKLDNLEADGGGLFTNIEEATNVGGNSLNAWKLTDKDGNYYYMPKVTGPTWTVNPSVLPAVTTSANGAMLAADKTKLDGIEAGAQANYVTNVSIFGGDPGSAYGVKITTTGQAYDVARVTDGKVKPAVLPVATTSANGAMSSTDKTIFDTADLDALTEEDVVTLLAEIFPTQVEE